MSETRVQKLVKKAHAQFKTSGTKKAVIEKLVESSLLNVYERTKLETLASLLRQPHSLGVQEQIEEFLLDIGSGRFSLLQKPDEGFLRFTRIWKATITWPDVLTEEQDHFRKSLGTFMNMIHDDYSSMVYNREKIALKIKYQDSYDTISEKFNKLFPNE